MTLYRDGNANDVNANEDNYWVFVTGVTVGNANQADTFVNYSFKPSDLLDTDIILEAPAGDTWIDARNSGNFVQDTEGIRINQQFYEYARNWIFTVEISYAGQTETVTSNILVSRIVHPDNDATDPLHGTAIMRFRDPELAGIFGGPDGAGYTLAQIESVTLTSTNGNEQNRIVINQIYDGALPVCFARGTGIRAKDGVVCVENLQVGDMILTRDNGLQPIRWIGSRQISAEELAATPNLRPIRIRAGALGVNTPAQDLIVSPQHRLLIRSKIAQRMFGTDEVLMAAKQLLELDGIEIINDATEVEYFHFLFNQHEIVFANGAETESLYTGPQALRSVGEAAREEIFTIFPELRNQDYVANSARPLISGRAARQFAHRQAKNNHELAD